MTAVTEDTADTQTTQAVEELPASTLAPWWARALALAVDILPGAAVVATMALAALAVPLGGLWWWSCVSVGGLAMVLTATNRILLPVVTGWSLGRAVFGIAVQHVDNVAIRPVGPWRLLIRDLAHLLDTASVLVGWLWPLWDRRRRTFADMLVHTEVRRSDPTRRPQNVPALAAVVFLAASLLSITVGPASALVVYQHDRAVDQARVQIATQGPKIVEQMLSYDPDSLQDDFARAQALVTDNYRERLVAEQQAVQKAKPVHNAYWVVNRSVLSAAPNRATMLLFLQGQRGDQGKERLISATVRVAFEKSASAQWRVDDLTVVTKPLPAEDGN
ncbi:MAG TPA: RDD family protein [Mycobacterium sp.]|nr:RDD family protein [Mycobacterium sp.]